jgi:hypothetical protein
VLFASHENPGEKSADHVVMNERFGIQTGVFLDRNSQLSSCLGTQRLDHGPCAADLLERMLRIGSVDPALMEQFGEANSNIEAIPFVFQEIANFIGGKKAGAFQEPEDLTVKFSRVLYLTPRLSFEPRPSASVFASEI